MCLMWLIVVCLLGLMPCMRKPCWGACLWGAPLSPTPLFCWLFFVVFGGGVCGCVSWLGE